MDFFCLSFFVFENLSKRLYNVFWDNQDLFSRRWRRKNPLISQK
jgi:hypothetical protein